MLAFSNHHKSKMLRLILLSLSSLVLAIVLFSSTSKGCNEAVCASIVSKCMITQSCKCDMKNCTCCKDCLNCLSYLWTECCSCVDLCPKPNSTATSELSKQSHVEDLTDAIPTLFKVLTSESDTLHRFDTITFPVDFPIAQFKPQYEKEIKYKMQTSDQETADPLTAVTLNCTVAYMSTCMSWSKCKTSCRSMGSTSVRWFHDGCCECIGDTCINYGINQSRCQNCTTVAISHLSPDQMDYGEDDDETEEPPPAVSSEVDATAKKTATTGGEKDESGKKKEEVKTSENKTETHVQ
ncbi:hypothetical protein M8J76_009135 [Diaphorina citri]|nr:hypothetical protein M8J76_009135 [Diaphorina citri]